MLCFFLPVVVAPYKVRRNKYIIVEKNKYVVLLQCGSSVSKQRSVSAVFYTSVRDDSRPLRIEKVHNFISVIGT